MSERLTCCTAAGAWAWVDLFTAEALAGDHIARKLLPRAIHHALVIQAQG